jgi:hypothetical protein
MSLKAFHLVFITASSAMCAGCGVWGLKNFLSADGRATDLVFALGAFVAGVALIVYERFFLKKLKHVSYL